MIRYFQKPMYSAAHFKMQVMWPNIALKCNERLFTSRKHFLFDFFLFFKKRIFTLLIKTAQKFACKEVFRNSKKREAYLKMCTVKSQFNESRFNVKSQFKE